MKQSSSLEALGLYNKFLLYIEMKTVFALKQLLCYTGPIIFYFSQWHHYFFSRLSTINSFIPSLIHSTHAY